MSNLSNKNRNNGNGTTDDDKTNKTEREGVTGRTSAIKIMK